MVSHEFHSPEFVYLNKDHANLCRLQNRGCLCEHKMKQETESTRTATHDCFFVGQHWKHYPPKCTLTHQWSQWDFALEINAVLMLNSCPKYCPTVLNGSCCLLVSRLVRRKAEAGIKLWIDIAGWQVGWVQLLAS